MSGPAKTRDGKYLFFPKRLIFCLFHCFLEIDAQMSDFQSRKKPRIDQGADSRAAFGAAGEYDQDVYGGSMSVTRGGYYESIPNDRENDVSAIILEFFLRVKNGSFVFFFLGRGRR